MRMEKRLGRLKATMDQRAVSLSVGVTEFAQFVLWLTLAPFVQIMRLRRSVGL